MTGASVFRDAWVDVSITLMISYYPGDGCDDTYFDIEHEGQIDVQGYFIKALRSLVRGGLEEKSGRVRQLIFEHMQFKDAFIRACADGFPSES
eukprot:scaffold196358_cov17-Tisochrysis_lutea.AAC.1